MSETSAFRAFRTRSLALQPRHPAAPPGDVESPPPVRGRLGRAFLGGPDDARLARPLLWLLLVGTAALYLINLASSGYANEFYAAAVKSGTVSLKAWLFGSLDSANAITVDKPPASLWLMVLSARIFGFSSFSLLLPQALLGVAAVGTLYATVKRWAGAYAGLLAGALLALTPVAALMFRFDNPDAMLVALMTLAAYAVVRAIDAGTRPARRTALGWMLLAGGLVGTAFLTKMAQGMLVLPAFGLVYLVASPLRLRARIGHLLAAAGAMVVGAGWFVALVELWPAAARPYIGGSTNNSLWELAIGYNGLGRIFSGAGNGGGGGGGGGSTNTGFGGATGVLRMFGTAFGTQISWLIPAALLALVAGLVMTRRALRTDRTRAGLLLWGGWLVVTMVVFSFMSGTIHPYYSVALAPAIGGLTATGGAALWRARSSHLARGTLAVMIAGTAVWGFVLMNRDAGGWQTWLAWAMLVGGVLGGLVLAVSTGRLKKLAIAAALVGALSALAGTASFTVATVASGHSGSIPMAGPSIVSTASGMGGVGGQGGPGGGGRPPTGTKPQNQTGATSSGRTTSGTGTSTAGSTSTTGSTSTSTSTAASPSTSTSGSSTATTTRQGGGGVSSSTALVDLLNKTSSRWSAAVVGDQSAAGLILSTNTAVMAIGGWSGSDAAPTLAQFQQYVADGDITYFIAGSSQGGGGQSGSDSTASQITAWVSAHYTATTVGGTTVYDLSS